MKTLTGRVILFLSKAGMMLRFFQRIVTHQFPRRIAGHLGFLFQRIPTGFSTGLKSRQSGGTMSRSLLSSALRVTEIERLMSYHDCHAMIGEQYMKTTAGYLYLTFIMIMRWGLCIHALKCRVLLRPCTPDDKTGLASLRG